MAEPTARDSAAEATAERHFGDLARPPRRRARSATAFVAVLSLAAVTALLIQGASREPDEIDPVALARSMSVEAAASLAQNILPDEYAGLSPREAVRRVADDPAVAIERSQAAPSADADDPIESGLAGLLSIGDDVDDAARVVSEVYRELSDAASAWMTAVFPGVVGNLPGAPYSERMAANEIRLTAAVAESAEWPTPPRPWTQDVERAPRADLERAADENMDLVYFDQLANSGNGSWVELAGDLDTAEHVAVIVPGGSAYITSDNFTRYSKRAHSFVDASDGELAVLVWAAASFPTGWVQEASPSWAEDAAPQLVDFMDDVRRQVGDSVPLTLVGHSYGGAVVGLAETYELDADQILHVASAGAGYGVDSPGDYTQPCRTRYAMMAPGDPVSYVTGMPYGARLGHGVDSVDLEGTTRLDTGYLPDDPEAYDDVGRTLGDLGVAGHEIAGVHSHSEVFVPESGAWRNMLAVMLGEPTTLAGEQPSFYDGCL
ncbi:MAG: alpha/beta hydrolase [Stackebrandtia sp.]